MKSVLVRLILASLWLFVLGSSVVMARQVLRDETCHVAEDTIVAGNLFVLCQNLRIDGEVRGNVIGGAVRADIAGRVEGSLYLLGGRARLNGQMGGDVHFAGLDLHINQQNMPEAPRPHARVAGGLISIALSTTLDAGLILPESIITFGYQLIIRGVVDDEVNFWGSALRVEGVVTGDVFANVGDPDDGGSQIETLLLPLGFELDLISPGLTLTEASAIGGQLTYTGPAQGRIEGRLAQAPNYTPVDLVPLTTLEQPGALRIYAEQFLRDFSSLLVVGLAGLIFVPRALQAPLSHFRRRPVSSLSVGLLAFILSFPILLIVVVLTVLLLVILGLLRLDGLVLVTGFFLGVANVTLAGTFYFVAIFVARVIVALGLGRVLVRMRWRGNITQGMLYVYLVVGTLLLTVLASLPVIGWLINAGALFMGLGALLTVMLELISRVREGRASLTGYAWYAPSPIITGPRPPLPQVPQAAAPPMPPEDEAPTAPGMQNLPPGFDWDFFREDDEDA